MTRFFGKPRLDDQEKALERRKREIRDFFLFCESRANSLNLLLTERAREDTSALEDARILFEKLLLDLLNLHFMMQNAPTANDINEALPRVREIQDPGQTGDYETLLALRERWSEYQNRQDVLFDELNKPLTRLLEAHNDWLTKLSRTTLYTRMDMYRSRLKRWLVVYPGIAVLAALVAWGTVYYLRLPPSLTRISLDGEKLAMGSEMLPLETTDGGYLDFISDAGGFVTFLGWAGNIGFKHSAKYVLVFIDDIPVAIGRPDVYREDLAKISQNLARSGYALRLNLFNRGLDAEDKDIRVFVDPKTGRDHKLTAESRVRAFGIFEGRVVELSYGQGVSLPHGQ